MLRTCNNLKFTFLMQLLEFRRGDTEPPVFSTGRGPFFTYFGYIGTAGTALQVFKQLLQIWARPFGNHFYLPIVLVTHPTGEANELSLIANIIAKADALYVSFNRDVQAEV